MSCCRWDGAVIGERAYPTADEVSSTEAVPCVMSFALPRQAQSAPPACRGSICNCTQTGADEQAAECQTDAVSISTAACQVPDDLSRQAGPAGRQPATLR